MSERVFAKSDHGDQCQAIWDAMHACGEDYNLVESESPEGKLYDWLERSPRTSLPVGLVNKLHKMGFKITKV